MQRTHLAPVILQLKALGVDNVLRFNYIAVSLSNMYMFIHYFILATARLCDDSRIRTTLCTWRYRSSWTFNESSRHAYVRISIATYACEDTAHIWYDIMFFFFPFLYSGMIKERVNIESDTVMRLSVIQ